MKLITQIQSISDIITNSSSEVFLMSVKDATYYDSLEDTNGCISIEEITWSWLENNIYDWEMVCEFLGIAKKEISTYYKNDNSWWGHWNTPNQEDWKAFLELHREEIEEKLIGLYFVSIEDHFSDACSVTEDARSDSYWSESRH